MEKKRTVKKRKMFTRTSSLALFFWNLSPYKSGNDPQMQQRKEMCIALQDLTYLLEDLVRGRGAFWFIF